MYRSAFINAVGICRHVRIQGTVPARMADAYAVAVAPVVIEADNAVCGRINFCIGRCRNVNTRMEFRQIRHRIDSLTVRAGIRCVTGGRPNKLCRLRRGRFGFRFRCGLGRRFRGRLALGSAFRSLRLIAALGCGGIGRRFRRGFRRRFGCRLGNRDILRSPCLKLTLCLCHLLGVHLKCHLLRLLVGLCFV